MLKHEIYKGFVNKKFYLCIVISIGFAAYGFYEAACSYRGLLWGLGQVNENTEFGRAIISKANYAASPLNVWLGLAYTSATSLLFYIMPLLCTLPYGISYIKELKEGYTNVIFSRVEKYKYYSAKWITTFLSGGIVASMPLIFSLIIGLMFFPVSAAVPVPGVGAFPVAGYSVLGSLFYTHPYFYIVIYILVDFIYFGLLNCIVLVVSCVETNMFIVSLSPFFIYLFLHAISSWMFGDWTVSPQRYTSLCFMYDRGLIAMLIHIGLMLASFVIFFMRAGKKKDGIITL